MYLKNLYATTTDVLLSDYMCTNRIVEMICQHCRIFVYETTSGHIYYYPILCVVGVDGLTALCPNLKPGALSFKYTALMAQTLLSRERGICF